MMKEVENRLLSLAPGRTVFLEVRVEMFLSADQVVVTVKDPTGSIKQLVVSPDSLAVPPQSSSLQDKKKAA